MDPKRDPNFKTIELVSIQAIGLKDFGIFCLSPK